MDNWVSQIENYSIFGEIAYYKEMLSLIVFDKITEYGMKSLQKITKYIYGNIPYIYVEYDETHQRHTTLLHFIN